MNDMGKAQQIGIPAYNAEQEEKRKILDFLLASYNDGRRKSLFCIAVNLLEVGEIENILQAVKSDKEFQGLSKKEQASIIAKQLQDIAANKGIVLKLRKNWNCHWYSSGHTPRRGRFPYAPAHAG